MGEHSTPLDQWVGLLTLNYNYLQKIIIIIILLFWEFFTPVLADAFRWSLSNSKSPGLFSVFWPILIML